MKERECKELYKGSKRFKRGTFVRGLGIVGGGALVVASGFNVASDGFQFSQEQRAQQKEFIATYPDLPINIREDAALYEFYLGYPRGMSDSLDRFNVGGFDTINERASNLDDDTSFKQLSSAYVDYKDWEEERDKIADDSFNKEASLIDELKQVLGVGMILGGSLSGLLGHVPNIEKRRAKKRRIISLESIIEKHTKNPEHLLHSFEDFKEFITKLQILPPVGGKIITFDKHGNHNVILQRPTYLAEDLCDEVIKRQRKGSLGELYIHQLTVQGRLPDEFKYAALALILNSPYANDWERPFFNSPWGSVAPLVHDGGVVDLSLNPNWKNSRGRTDFLQRMYVPGDDKDAFEHEHNKIEEERMRREARFYQRAAFGLLAVCQNSTNIEDESEQQRRMVKLTGMFWNDFILSMECLFAEYGIEDILQVPWMNEKPRSLWRNYHPRYEADWDPIQKSLLRLEEVRQNHQIEIRERVSSLISTFSNRIDFAIGLDAYLKKPEESEAA